jgi:dipeptidyl aminopeptidase/acylaminoacyl peptidase
MFRAVTVFVFAGCLAAQTPVLTPERIMRIRRLAAVELSPGGEAAALQILRPRTKDEKPGPSISEIWMIATQGGEPRRFLWNAEGDTAPQFSPDGRTLAFLSRRGGSPLPQIYLIPLEGGEARPLTKSPTGVNAFKWSPDGKRIAYIALEEKSKEQLEAESAGRDWIVAGRNYRHPRLHVIDVSSGESRMVSGAVNSVQDFDWSPDGAAFVLKVTDAPTVDDDFMKARLAVIPSGGGAARPVAKTEGKLTHPRWSPDGRWIAWLGATALNDPYAGSVFYAPSTGGAAVHITPGYEGTANGLEWLPGAPATLAVHAIERQNTKVWTISVPERAKTTLLSTSLVTQGVPSFTRDGKSFAFAATLPSHPAEVYFSAGGSEPKRLTFLNPHLDGVALGAQEIVKWKHADGTAIEGVLIKPVGYEKGKRYPLVMQVHGGPESADLNGWFGSYSAWGQMLAGHGFAVLYPNYRGSIGRGVKFSMADQRDLMGKEFEDMLAGIDHLIAAGIADKDRVGVGGGSYGGYTSAWAATFASERFKAAVPMMGISNWFSMTGTSDIFLENSLVHWDLMMYDPKNHEIYWKRSPMAWIHKANTPALIVHGAADTRVPIGQSQELYTALKWKGVPVEFVTYPRAGHGLTENAHQLDFMQRVLAWFEKYLK